MLSVAFCIMPTPWYSTERVLDERVPHTQIPGWRETSGFTSGSVSLEKKRRILWYSIHMIFEQKRFFFSRRLRFVTKFDKIQYQLFIIMVHVIMKQSLLMNIIFKHMHNIKLIDRKWALPSSGHMGDQCLRLHRGQSCTQTSTN